MSVHLREGQGELAALRGEWSALCDRAAVTPFQRPEWLLPWARWLGTSAPLAVEVRDAGILIGLAPLYIDRTGGRAGGERVVRLLGAGVSDYLDAVAAPGREREVAAAVLAELGARRGDFDCCHLEDLRASSPLLGPPPPGWQAEDRPAAVCPHLALEPGAADQRAALPPGQWRRLRQYERRARREGELTLVRADASSAPALITELFRLHRARWRHREQGGVLDSRELECFHREAAGEFAVCDRLALYALELDRRAIACLYGLVEDEVLYFYLCGFEPAVAALSPGTLCIGLAIEDMGRRGARAIDFLRGGEPYKYRFGARDQLTTSRLLRQRDAGKEPGRRTRSPGPRSGAPPPRGRRGDRGGRPR